MTKQEKTKLSNESWRFWERKSLVCLKFIKDPVTPDDMRDAAYDLLKHAYKKMAWENKQTFEP